MSDKYSFTRAQLKKYVMRDRKNVLKVLGCKGGVEQCPGIPVIDEWKEFFKEHFTEIEEVMDEERMPVLQDSVFDLNEDEEEEDEEENDDGIDEVDDEDDEDEDDEDEDDEDEDEDDEDEDDEDEDDEKSQKKQRIVYGKCATKSYLAKHPGSSLKRCSKRMTCKKNPKAPGKICVLRKKYTKKNKSLKSSSYTNKSQSLLSSPVAKTSPEILTPIIPSVTGQTEPSKQNAFQKIFGISDKPKVVEGDSDEDKKEYEKIVSKIPKMIDLFKDDMNDYLKRVQGKESTAHEVFLTDSDSVFNRVEDVIKEIKNSEKVTYKEKKEKLMDFVRNIKQLYINVQNINTGRFGEYSIPDGKGGWNENVTRKEIIRFYISKDMDKYLDEYEV